MCSMCLPSFQKQYPSSKLLLGLNTRESITDDQCDLYGVTEYPIGIVECSGSQFLGVYEPDIDQLVNWLDFHVKGNITGNITADTDYSSTYYRRRRLLASSTVNSSLFSGIANPVVCLNYGQIIFFYVDNNNYPIYDRSAGFHVTS